MTELLGEFHEISMDQIMRYDLKQNLKYREISESFARFAL